MLLVLLFGLVAFIQIGIALTVLIQARRTQRKDLYLFALATTTLIMWTVLSSVLVFVDTAPLELIGFFNVVNRVTFSASALTLASVYLFGLFYPKKLAITLVPKLTLFGGLALAIIAPFDIVAGVFANESGQLAYHVGALSLSVVAYAFWVIGVLIFNNFKNLRHSKSLLEKKQATTLLSGLSLTIVHAITFILVLPLVFGQQPFLYAIGYMAPIYFVALTVFGLLKQGLFNIRSFIARATAYILSLTLLLLSSIAIFTLASRVLTSANITIIGEELIYAVLIVALAIVYQPVKKQFNRLTSKVFYRDGYDTQQLLNDLNSSLVTTMDAQAIMRNSALLLEHYLKPTYVYFTTLAEKSSQSSHSVEEFTTSKERKSQLPLRKLLVTMNHDITSIDSLGEQHSKLKQKMLSYDASVVIRLKSSIAHEKVLGYLVFGPKKSGNGFNAQDQNVIRIISDVIAIAFQNALHFEEIQQFNVTLQDKVDKVTKELRHANEKLIAMDQTKDDFISMASHQLRTPLTSAKGYVSMVLEGDVGKITKQQRKLLDQAYLSSQRMVYLIADLLNVSRLKTGKFVIEPKPTNLAELVESELEQLKETAKSRELELTYDKPKDFPTLNLDDTKIRQVVMNFVDNAIYYTPNGGHICVCLENKEHTVEFTVVDDGIGVPKSEQHHLFTKFYRAGNARKARPDGTGLGLFMAKKVVIAQGGTIIFKTQEGKGSTFGFSFEKKKLHTEQPASASKGDATKRKKKTQKA